MRNKDEIIDAIQGAIANFDGWDWAQDFPTADPAEQCAACRGIRLVFDGPHELDRYTPECDHERAALEAAREYAREVESAAAEAAEFARQAIDAIGRGDWDEAAKLLARAESLESQYGDSPAYGAVARRVSAIAEEMEVVS